MKRRREIGPKKLKNRSALIKYLIFAFLAGLVGSALAWLAHTYIGPPVEKSEEEVSLLSSLSGIIITGTILAVVGLVFFGVRGYLSGTKVKRGLLNARAKRKFS